MLVIMSRKYSLREGEAVKVRLKKYDCLAILWSYSLRSYYKVGFFSFANQWPKGNSGASKKGIEPSEQDRRPQNNLDSLDLWAIL